MNPFHLALPVKEIAATRNFYENVLGCPIGRSSHNWIDVNFYGHQITFQERPKVAMDAFRKTQNDLVPLAHFGVVLTWAEWHQKVDALRDAGIPFSVAPGLAMEGQVGEQARFFVADPNGYGIEFKAFESQDGLFKA